MKFLQPRKWQAIDKNNDEAIVMYNVMLFWKVYRKNERHAAHWV